ncbi:MAG: glycosyltransferase family 9 protein [Pseudomonadota bacterium]|nr:glycosyltransferase family 9 protein [Pseudomonadota bacterium]
MKLLFISSSPLGDAVLTTGILDHLLGRFPNARVTVACGPAAASLFAACPAVEKVIVIDKTKGKRYVLDLWRATVLTRWDLIVDLRNNIVSRLVLARRRMVRSGGARRDIHKIMELAERLNLPVTAPHLWLTDSAIAKAQEWIPDGPVLALGPTANWAGKIWAPERFAELASRLTDPKTGILPGATIAIFAGPGEEKLAQPVFDALEDRRTLAIIGHNDLVAVAATCISPESLPM